MKRFALALFVSLAMLIGIGGTALADDRPPTGPHVPLPNPVPGAVVAGLPFNTWPMCADQSRKSDNCRWDARLKGVAGPSWVKARGVVHYVSLSPTPARGTLAYFPQCKTASGPGICWYSANTRGTGLGLDYYVTANGKKKFLPYQMIES